MRSLSRDKERCRKNREIAKKVARLLSESQTSYNDIPDIFRQSMQFLSVKFTDRDDENTSDIV